LESGIFLSEPRYINIARKAADVLLELQSQDGFLRARYGMGWKSQLNWSCLTGAAQMAVIWIRLYELTNEENYVQGALDAIRYIKKRQSTVAKLRGVRGGVAGSFPIYCDYEPYRNLNWAAKFFADGLMLAEELAPTHDLG